MNLATNWRDRAKTIAPYAPAVAQAISDCADELEKAQRDEVEQLVSPAEGELISGYDADSIGRMIKSGRLTNHGSKRRPKVRRGDLPKKPGHDIDVTAMALDAKRKPA